jgi:outer membrane protein TolC
MGFRSKIKMMDMRKRLTVYALVCSGALAAQEKGWMLEECTRYAQEKGWMLEECTRYAVEKGWTLEECTRYAVEHNLQRGSQEARNEIYRQEQRAVVGGLLPSLSAGSSASVNFGRGVDPETNTYTMTSTFSNAYNLNSSVTLFEGFTRLYYLKMARLQRSRGEGQLEEMTRRVALEVMELFFNVLYYQGTVELARQQWEESVANARRAGRREELGLVSLPEMAEIRAREAGDRFLLTRQENLLRLEIIKLKEKMNFPLEEELPVAGDAEMPVPARAAGGAGEIYRAAVATLPVTRVAASTLSMAEMEYKIARGRRFPTLSASAGFSTGFSRLVDATESVSFREQMLNRRGGYASLSLSVPLFGGLARASEVKKSRQRLVIARNEHEELLRQLYREIEQAVTGLEGLAGEVEHARERTTAALEAHRLNTRKHEEGLIDAIAWSTSANRLLEARVEELHVTLRYRLQHRLVAYYKGELIINN